MKLNASNNPMLNTPPVIKEVVDTFMQDHARYISRLVLRGRDAPSALERLMKPVLARAVEAGIKVDNKTKGRIRDYLGCKYLHQPAPKKEYTYVYNSPPVTMPVVSRNCDAEVGPLWTQAIEILNNRGIQLDETMATAIINHRNSLAIKEAENYLPLHVAEIWIKMAEVNDPTYWDHNQVQESARIQEDARSSGHVNCKLSRAVFQTAKAKQVNTRAKKFFEEKLKEKYDISSVDEWSGRTINLYNITSERKAEELNLALAWWDIVTEGKTARCAELDHNTSGMSHMMLQTGNWKRQDIDASHIKWVKLYVHVARKLRDCPWVGDMSWKELLVIAKKIMAGPQYGGGPYSIASQFFKNLKHDGKKWLIPTKAHLDIPKEFYELFTTQVYNREVLPMPVLDDMSNGLDRFHKEVLKKYYRMFIASFPWIKTLNIEMIEWSENHVGELIRYEDGFTRRIHTWKDNDLKTKIKLNLYDRDGFRRPTGVLPMDESPLTEGMAMETHHLDALQMVLLIIQGDKDNVDIFPILDAACVNVADLEWLETTSSKVFIEVHSKPRFPIGIENFKLWTGDIPIVWGF